MTLPTPKINECNGDLSPICDSLRFSQCDVVDDPAPVRADFECRCGFLLNGDMSRLFQILSTVISRVRKGA
jgi:hypothetical protein